MKDRSIYEKTSIFFISVLSVLVIGCRNEVRFVKAESKKGTIAIGYIENRDLRHSPFAAVNLRDMLKFEILQSGYQISIPDVEIIQSKKKENPIDIPKEKEIIPVPENSETDVEKSSFYKDEIRPDSGKFVKMALALSGESPDEKKVNDTTNFLPESMNNVAGENQNIFTEEEKRILKDSEIEILAKNLRFEYFIQGAIVNSDNGKFIDNQKNSLLFLEIFDKEGKRFGAINFTTNDKDFSDNGLLKEVCSKVITALTEKKTQKWYSFPER